MLYNGSGNQTGAFPRHCAAEDGERQGACGDTQNRVGLAGPMICGEVC